MWNMKSIPGPGCAWAILPLACGVLGGAGYSRWILGHQPAGSGGWLDLGGLDPLNFAIRDGFFSILSACGGCLVYAVLLWIAMKIFKVPKVAAPIAAVSAAVITSAFCINAILPELGERAQAKKVDDAKSLAEERAWAWADSGCSEAFTHMGWIAYPVADHPPKGTSCENRWHVAMDSIDVVFNYFLSRAVSWEENQEQVLCIAQNEGQSFLITLEKKNPPVILYNLAKTDKQLANLGPNSWPISSSPAPLRDLGQLTYPNGQREDRPSTTAFITQDSVEQAGSYYLKLQASRTDSTTWARAYVTQINERQAYILILPNPSNNGIHSSETLVEIYVKS